MRNAKVGFSDANAVRTICFTKTQSISNKKHPWAAVTTPGVVEIYLVFLSESIS